MKEINITHYTEEEIRELMNWAYEQEEFTRLMDEANEIEYIMGYRNPMVIAI